MSSLFGQIPPDELQQLPALAPPPGEVPNFDDPENRGPILVAVSSLLFALMLLLYLNRIYTKLFIIGSVSLDDLTLTIGMVGAIAVYAGAVVGAHQGPIGKHQWDTSVAEIISRTFIFPSYIDVVLIAPTFLFLKATFFLMYIQVFKPFRWLRMSSYIGLILLTCFYGATTIVQFYFGTPGPHETWVEHWTSTKIKRANTLSIPLAAVGLAFDVAILVLPIAGVLKLQLPKNRKIGISLIFATGILACVGSILSIYYRSITRKSQDGTWNLLDVELVVIVEMYIGVICACMPALHKTIRHHSPTIESLRGLLGSGFSGFRSNRSGNTGRRLGANDARGRKESTPQENRSGDKGPYYNISAPESRDTNLSVPLEYELGQLKSVHSLIGTGRRDVVATDDRIHLTREVRVR